MRHVGFCMISLRKTLDGLQEQSSHLTDILYFIQRIRRVHHNEAKKTGCEDLPISRPPRRDPAVCIPAVPASHRSKAIENERRVWVTC